MTLLRDSLVLIEKFAMLCSTPGIDADTQKLANEQIQKLITSVVKPEITKLSAEGNGLILSK